MALPIGIEAIVSARNVESYRIEYKKNWNPDECIRTLCAFANDLDNVDGGYLILGVEEKNGRPVLPPSGVNPDSVDAIEKDLLNKCHFIEPFYYPRVETSVYEGKTLIVLWASAGDGRPYKASRNVTKDQSEKYYFVRRGSSTVQADGNTLRTLFENSSRIPFDDRENPFASTDELNRELMLEHLRKTGSSLCGLADTMTTVEIASDMRLLSGPKENRFPRNVALLMFSRHTAKYFPYAYIEIVDIPDPTGTGMTEKTFTGPVQNQLSDALEFISNYMLEEKIIKTDSQIETERVWNYPITAIKEILANAVYHRSYQISEPITVTKTPGYIEIKSFPGLDRSITDEMIGNLDIKSSGEYRNRRIGNFLKELGLTEGRNTGIPTAIKSLNDNGSGKPVFITDYDRQSLTVRIPIHPMFEGFGTASRINPSKQRTKEELKMEILSLLANGSCSARRLAFSMGYSGVNSNIKNAIQELVNNGVIKKTGTYKSTVYSLK